MTVAMATTSNNARLEKMAISCNCFGETDYQLFAECNQLFLHHLFGDEHRGGGVGSPLRLIALLGDQHQLGTRAVHLMQRLLQRLNALVRTGKVLAKLKRPQHNGGAEAGYRRQHGPAHLALRTAMRGALTVRRRSNKRSLISSDQKAKIETAARICIRAAVAQKSGIGLNAC